MMNHCLELDNAEYEIAQRAMNTNGHRTQRAKNLSSIVIRYPDDENVLHLISANCRSKDIGNVQIGFASHVCLFSNEFNSISNEGNEKILNYFLNHVQVQI
jgi:hypothetical protein